MNVILVLRSVLGRWQWVGFIPFVIYVVVFGGPTVATGMAVWLMGIVGWIAGTLARDLSTWPNRTLVPGYTKTLFHTVLVVLVLVPLGCGILWTMVGTPPPFGPGLLWGTTMALCVVRFRSDRAALSTQLVGIIGLGFYLIWAAKQAMHPVVFESLTDLRLQLPTFALSTLTLSCIRRELNAPLPATAPDIAAVEREPRLSKLVGLMAGPRARLRREVVASLPLVVLALLLMLLIRAGITTYPMSIVFAIACLVYALMRVVGRLANIHMPLRSFWLSGAVASRKALGRKCALPILLRALGWLPAGLAGAAILAIGTRQTDPFDGVFLIALTMLLAVVLFFGNVRHIPSPTRGWQVTAMATLCGGLMTPLVYGFELGWAGRSAVVLGLAVLAVATWYAVARALARAEIVQ